MKAMSKQKGITLIELLVVVAVASLVVVAAAAYSVPMISREAAKSAIFDVQTYIQLARVEAISRNRECLFYVDSTERRLLVLDGMGTLTLSDDVLIHETRLPARVRFGTPDGSDPVTSIPVDGMFQTIFLPDGALGSGTGNITLYGGERYVRVQMFKAGGARVQHWDGQTWVAGS